MLNIRTISPLFWGLGVMLTTSAVEAATVVQVSIENLAPSNGIFLTPVWIGFHNGGFDLYNRGEAASESLERLAEDGDAALLNTDFSTSGSGLVQETVSSSPIAPGQIVTAQFILEETLASSRYFSYASMVIPSNDAFIANGNPLAFRIFDDLGNFLGADSTVLGSQVLDAGTEINDEIPANTAFLGQTVPNTGVDENGTVELHPGFIPNGTILTDSRFSNADFTQTGYQVARIRVTRVDIPESDMVKGLLSLIALLGLGKLVGKNR